MLRSIVCTRNINSFVRHKQILPKNVKRIECGVLSANKFRYATTAADENPQKPLKELQEKTNPFSGTLTIQTEKLPPLSKDINRQAQMIADSTQTDFGGKDVKNGATNSFQRGASAEHGKQPPLEGTERERRLKMLQLEADIGSQEGRRVPSLDFFTDTHWEEILQLPTKTARMKYYSYLWQLQMRKASKARQKLERAESAPDIIAAKRKEKAENTHIIYGLGETSFFLRIYDSAITHWQHNRLTRAMQFAPKIVLDCSYEEHMTKRESKNTAKQLMFCFADNRAHDDPFDLHFCNVDMQTHCMQSLKKSIPTMLNPEFPMNIHEECFTKLFPKEQLVYLTPHCRTELKTYNPDDVYIIGAMVDKVHSEPLSLAKAKRLNLRMACLPLDRHLQWGSGSGKSLTLDQMIKIMLDLKHTKDWDTALQHVPRRKVVNLEKEAQHARRNLEERRNQLNVRLDKVLDYEYDIYEKSRNRTVRSRKENMQFNLDTWATKKKNRNG